MKVPFGKLFAVATLVGAASGTTVAVSHRDAPPVDTPVAYADEAPVDFVGPVQPELTLVRPLVLASGSPACGNVVSKAGRTRACPPPVTAATVIVGAVVASGATADAAGIATRAKPRPFQFHLLR